MEIRFHGRGGQGAVTCAKLLAGVYARLGKSVQAFGDYAGERSGAPVRSYLRVSDEPITSRNKVYRPDHLLVLDSSLLLPGVMDGLADGGLLLVNTPEPPEQLGDDYARFRVATVDATEIARRHGIGSRSLVIVNTTIAGAFMRALDLPLAELEEAYRHMGLESNIAAAHEAWEAVRFAESRELVAAGADAPVAAAAAPSPTPNAASPPVVPLVEHVEGPAPGLRTGSWRTQRPVYVMHLAPCSGWCPAGNDVVGFVQTLGKQGEEAAAGVLARTSPLAGVCGRVCPAPCMDGCNRREREGPVNVRGLERWIADHAADERVEPLEVEQPRRIAVLGSGPAGLSAAYALARYGHSVTLFEGEEELGGLLRTGIPAFRLPREVLDREIARILSLNVEARTGTFLDRAAVEDLLTEYDGVILATGLQRSRRLDVPGVELAGVEQGLRFLHEVNLGETARCEGHVVVLGGGNTAVDCARSALRTGASEVTVLYRRTRDEMPAIPEEVEQADEEGVRFAFQRAPLAFRGNGRVAGVVAAEVEMGEPDDTGRRRPEVTPRSAELACDRVLLALGQQQDTRLLPPTWDLNDGQVHRAGDPLPVFAAGDLSTNDGTVAHAIGDGHRAATRLLAALGEEVALFERPDASCAVTQDGIRAGYFEDRERREDRLLSPEERVLDFREVNGGLSDPGEAFRCYSCGSCTHCDTCLVYCPEGIILRGPDGGYEIDLDYCKGCGVCVAECPRSGMEMVSG